MKKNDDKIRLEMTFGEFKKIMFYALEHADEPTMQLLDRLCRDKLNRLIDNELCTIYKTAPSKDAREKARLEYLERRGIPKDFRW